MGGESCTVLRLRLMRRLAMSLKLCLSLPKWIFCNVLQHYHQKNRLKKLKCVSFQKWGAPPAVKRPKGVHKVILDKIGRTALGLAQQWWNTPVLAKERVLSVCQYVCLSVSMSLCLSVCLLVCLSIFLTVRLSALISTISHQQANMQW